ncbi:MAG: sugar transferase, partial [Bacteroidia bacterium]
TDFERKRHAVKPGITGLPGVSGRNTLSWDERFKLDVYYVENISFMLDMKIIFLTFLKVIKREGINTEGAATSPKFTGAKKK